MTSLPEPLSAKATDSFAYYTIKDRLPVILSKIADTVYRLKNTVREQHGEEGTKELKDIVGGISKLRNELQTDKSILTLEDDRSDVTTWNKYLEEQTTLHGYPPSWFKSAWLYVECYMYRRVQEAVEKCNVLKSLDVFEEQKQKAFLNSQGAILILLNYSMKVIKDLEKEEELDVEKLFRQFIQVALWGNKCDLSISAGFENSQTSCPLDQVETLKDHILIDDLKPLWTCLRASAPGRVDIVLDNAGFELVTDLCLAEILLSTKLASSIHFHAKAFPWFVSDVTKQDFDWTLQTLGRSNSIAMNFFVQRWKGRLSNKSWNLQVHDYWTLPFDYSEMKMRCSDLHEELSKSSLIVFKGDLNYRKLVGDRNWDTTTPFAESLHGFHPAPLCTLRALKADVQTGLAEGQAKAVKEKDAEWMVNGNWAVISFCDKTVQ
ncbi:hypothetical protein ACJMK2_037343 [Sinanodonta woodiana]|uniref:Sugar phosphate phosphatase n=1 Tax=Sinanodonta woodiana TaxID=1069815 RepID=A0ABD3WK15_SINWO